MAQTTSIVDPWSGMIQGTETLRQAANAAEERKLNEFKMQLYKQQLAEGEMKLQQQRQAAEDLQARREFGKALEAERVSTTTPGYGSLSAVQAYENALKANQASSPAIWSGNATAPIPASGQGINIPTLSGQTSPSGDASQTGLGLGASIPSTAEQFNQNMTDKPYSQEQLDDLNERAIAEQQASGLTKYNPETTQRPLSLLEKSQRIASLQQQQGNMEGSLKTLESAVDVTGKFGERQQKVITSMFNTVKTMKQAGFDDNSIKSVLRQQADSINKLQGSSVIDPSVIDNLNINKTGDLITQDIGGGQKAVMVQQPNGNLTVHIVDTTKQDRLNLGYKNLELAKQRVSQGWNRLNPKAAAALEFAKRSGSEAAKKLYADNDAYNNAIEGNQILTEATDILNRDPAAIAGWSARLKATIGSIHPELEQALNSGDRKTFSRLMMSNADTFKKLLGPQISNADADLMFKLTGATASSESEIRAAIRTLRAKNDSTIGSYEHVLKGATGASPEAKPFSPQQRTKGTTAKNPKTGETIYLNSTGTGWVDRYGRPVK